MTKKKRVIAAGVCPICGHGLDYGDREVEGEGLYYDCRCPKCDFSGQEWYDLTFSGFHDDANDEGDLITPWPDIF